MPQRIMRSCAMKARLNAVNIAKLPEHCPRTFQNKLVACLFLYAVPPLWSVEDIGAAFVVTDNAGQQLAYVYFEEELGRRSAAKLLGKAFPRRATPMSDVRTAWPCFSGLRSTILRAYRRTDIASL
jgi:hypothetical protein